MKQHRRARLVVHRILVCNLVSPNEFTESDNEERKWEVTDPLLLFRLLRSVGSLSTSEGGGGMTPWSERTIGNLLTQLCLRLALGDGNFVVGTVLFLRTSKFLQTELQRSIVLSF